MATPESQSFVMHGAREAMANGLGHIEQAVEGIEQAVVDTPGLAFDLARTLVESTCYDILKQRNIPYSEKDDLPKIFRTVTQNLSFLPVTASDETKARKSLERTISGLSTIIQGICELRNHYGFASHGSDGTRAEMERPQALLAAGAADTVVAFLYRLHCQDRTPSPALDFDDNELFNDHVDDIHDSIQIFKAVFRPSEVLFQMDQELYRVSFDEFRSFEADTVDPTEE